MIQFKNKEFTGANGRKSLFDCEIDPSNQAVIIFIHGYKGFKDWGAWSLLGDFFLARNYGFVKFNMSHNGGTIHEPVDFPDLEAFGSNCYSYELYDLNVIIDEVSRMIEMELDAQLPIYLVGHSRGGGMAVLAAANNPKVSKLVSLAGICDIQRRFPADEELEDWKNDEVKYVLNGRTNQQMPHYFSFYEDFDRNRQKLNIQLAAEQLSVPFLQIHGDMDISVSISEGQELANWTKTDLAIIKGAEHTFGAVHPWEQNMLPEELEQAAKVIVEFFSK